MATGIYKTVNGERVELSAKEVKETIMKVNQWDEVTYNKERYKIKNKLRTYEAFTGEAPQSPTSFLYFEAKAKQRQGAKYNPSLKSQRIRNFQGLGSQKAIEKAKQSSKSQAKMRARYSETTYKQFEGLIKNNPMAKFIWEHIPDPVERERALTDYANKLNMKIDEENKVADAQAIPFGETSGSSDILTDFDLSEYGFYEDMTDFYEELDEDGEFDE